MANSDSDVLTESRRLKGRNTCFEVTTQLVRSKQVVTHLSTVVDAKLNGRSVQACQRIPGHHCETDDSPEDFSRSAQHCTRGHDTTSSC